MYDSHRFNSAFTPPQESPPCSHAAARVVTSSSRRTLVRKMKPGAFRPACLGSPRSPGHDAALRTCDRITRFGNSRRANEIVLSLLPYVCQNTIEAGGGLRLIKTCALHGNPKPKNRALNRSPFSQLGSVRIHRAACNADQAAHNVSRLIPLVWWKALHLSTGSMTGLRAPQTVTAS